MAADTAYVPHLLFAVLWVGGMAFGVLALMGGVHRRFLLVVWHAMPIVLLSGHFLRFGQYGGVRGAGWHVHLMHLTGLLMAAVHVAIFTGPWRQLRRALAAAGLPAAAAANERIGQPGTPTLALGLLTVGVAAWGRLG